MISNFRIRYHLSCRFLKPTVKPLQRIGTASCSEVVPAPLIPGSAQLRLPRFQGRACEPGRRAHTADSVIAQLTSGAKACVEQRMAASDSAGVGGCPTGDCCTRAGIDQEAVRHRVSHHGRETVGQQDRARTGDYGCRGHCEDLGWWRV
jgi:hypothetical protein